MADVADRPDLASDADVQLHRVSDTEQCLAAVRARKRPLGGIAWCAGEATSMAALRRVLVEELGVDRHAVRAAAYWKRDTTAFHEQLSD
jgi:NADPH-dependent ferric siderophore reductase